MQQTALRAADDAGADLSIKAFWLKMKVEATTELLDAKA